MKRERERNTERERQEISIVMLVCTTQCIECTAAPLEMLTLPIQVS